MAKFMLEINLGNAAMHECDITETLERVAKNILNNGTSSKRYIWDINGDCVGFYEVI